MIVSPRYRMVSDLNGSIESTLRLVRSSAPRILMVLAATASLLLPVTNSRADISIDRDILTVTTTNLIAVFRGPDLLRLTNRLTNEQYLRPPAPYRSLFDLGLLEPPGTQIAGDFWRKGRDETAAQFIAHDLTRTVYINAIIDPETQDITLTMWGESLKEGATGLTWGLRGLDLTGGRLLLPVDGGRFVDESTRIESLSLPYPGQWEAQMLVWEDRLNSGGFVVYSRDDELRYKRLHIIKHGPKADIGFETEAHAPWSRNGSVPAVEWRINTYKGDWRTPVTGYRSLMSFLRPPVPLKGPRAWVKDIRAVVAITGKEMNASQAGELAKQFDPKRTLVLLAAWRKDGYDPNSADYTPREGVHDFVDRAHELGFHVMLPIEPPGVNPQSSDFARVQRLRVRDSVTGKKPVDSSPSFAAYNPVKSFRDLVVGRIKIMLDDVSPDALYLPGAGTLPNDGNGLIDQKSFSQGAVALHKALLTAFPNLLLASEGTNEMISPYCTITVRTAQNPLQPHPISTMLFATTTFPTTLSAVPEGSGAASATERAIQLLGGQGVFPVITIGSTSELATPKPELERMLKLAKIWQEKDMLPDWTGNLKGLLFRWKGADGTIVSAEKSGTSMRLKLGDEVLFETSTAGKQPGQ